MLLPNPLTLVLSLKRTFVSRPITAAACGDIGFVGDCLFPIRAFWRVDVADQSDDRGTESEPPSARWLAAPGSDARARQQARPDAGPPIGLPTLHSPMVRVCWGGGPSAMLCSVPFSCQVYPISS